MKQEYESTAFFAKTPSRYQISTSILGNRVGVASLALLLISPKAARRGLRSQAGKVCGPLTDTDTGTANSSLVPKGGANKGKQVIRGFCHPDIHARVQLPVIRRLIDQCRVDGADPAAVSRRADIGREFDVGA
jgi:hypothetical protein